MACPGRRARPLSRQPLRPAWNRTAESAGGRERGRPGAPEPPCLCPPAQCALPLSLPQLLGPRAHDNLCKGGPSKDRPLGSSSHTAPLILPGAGGAGRAGSGVGEDSGGPMAWPPQALPLTLPIVLPLLAQALGKETRRHEGGKNPDSISERIREFAGGEVTGGEKHPEKAKRSRRSPGPAVPAGDQPGAGIWISQLLKAAAAPYADRLEPTDASVTGRDARWQISRTGRQRRLGVLLAPRAGNLGQPAPRPAAAHSSPGKRRKAPVPFMSPRA